MLLKSHLLSQVVTSSIPDRFHKRWYLILPSRNMVITCPQMMELRLGKVSDPPRSDVEKKRQDLILDQPSSPGYLENRD